MGVKLRVALVVVVALAASMLTLVGFAAPGESDHRTVGDAVAAASHAQRTAPAPVSPRDWRLTPLGGTGSQLLPWVLAAFALTASGMVGRRLRRIGDNGDDWRSLLEGAPPAVA